MNSSFYGCIVFHSVYVPHFPCPVYHQWAFRLVPGLCYCKQCCSEHACACVFIIEWFIISFGYISFGYIPSNGIAGSNGISISRSLKKCHTVFHNSWTNLHSHQQYKGIPISPYPLQHLWSPDFLMITIHLWHEMVSQCDFDLRLSNDQWCWAFFHIFVGLIYVFFWKVSVHILCPLLNGFVCFFLVNLF